MNLGYVEGTMGGKVKMSTDDFFDERTELSEVKSEIVSKYFTAWSRVMKSKSQRLGYIDLFSGPGRYKDGSESTPIQIIKKILSDDELCNKFITLFNDANPKYVEQLKRELESIPNIDKLRYKPIVINYKIDYSFEGFFEEMHSIPKLAFVDPWGYKGLSLRLVNALIKDWGCDCIFFFNYVRVNAAINNKKFQNHINELFGEDKANYLRNNVNELTAIERENFIINELASIVSNNGNFYVLPFRFVKPGERTSHYLIFVSKHFKGYEIMKEIMKRASSEQDDGVASFSYIPSYDKQLAILFGYTRPLDSLGEELLTRYAGRTLTMEEIYLDHNVGTPFVSSNYKEALRRLEEAKLIITDPPAEIRKTIKGGIKSFPDYVKVTFPNN